MVGRCRVRRDSLMPGVKCNGATEDERLELRGAVRDGPPERGNTGVEVVQMDRVDMLVYKQPEGSARAACEWFGVRSWSWSLLS